MSALHEPLKAEIEARLAAFHDATVAGDGDAAVYALLDVCAALARDAAQRSWTLRYEAEDRDDLMKEDEDELVFLCLKMPLTRICPELPGQVEGVLRDTFDDEHFRLDDPEGWADINDEGQGGSGGAAMSGSVIVFPRGHRDTIEVAPEGAGSLWRTVHVRAGGERLGLGDFVDLEAAKDFAYRTDLGLGRTRMLVLGEVPR